MARDLMDLIVETKQELPTWLEGMAAESRQQFSQRRTGGQRRLVTLYFNHNFSGKFTAYVISVIVIVNVNMARFLLLETIDFFLKLSNRYFT